jgi:hypothetical protein
MVASVEIAYVVRDTAADHPGLTAPARIIGMRSQGETEIAIEQGETRHESVTWATRRQRASNQLIPLPEPARARTDQPCRRRRCHHQPGCRRRRSTRPQRCHPIKQGPVNERISGVPSSHIRSPTRMIPPEEDHADELDVSHHSCIDGRGIVPFDADLPMYSLGSVRGSVTSCRPTSRTSHLALRSPM